MTWFDRHRAGHGHSGRLEMRFGSFVQDGVAAFSKEKDWTAGAGFVGEAAGFFGVRHGVFHIWFRSGFLA